MNYQVKRLAILSLILVTLASLLFVYGCGDDDDDDDLTSRTEEVEIELGPFDLLGGTGGPGALATASSTQGNPVCGATNLDELLNNISEWIDLEDYLEAIEIGRVRYKITSNSSTADIAGRFQMTDLDTLVLSDIASVSIPAGTTVSDWTALTFASGGASIVNHYLQTQNRSTDFTYCVDGSPDTSELSLTMEIQLNINVTVSIL